MYFDPSGMSRLPTTVALYSYRLPSLPCLTNASNEPVRGSNIPNSIPRKPRLQPRWPPLFCHETTTPNLNWLLLFGLDTIHCPDRKHTDCRLQITDCIALSSILQHDAVQHRHPHRPFASATATTTCSPRHHTTTSHHLPTTHYTVPRTFFPTTPLRRDFAVDSWLSCLMCDRAGS